MEFLILVLTIQFIMVIAIYAILVYACKFTLNKVKSKSYLKDSRFSNPMEYFPQEKISSLKQVFYLIMIFAFILLIPYLIFNWNESAHPFFVLDVIISIYLTLNIRGDTLKDKIILFMLIPFGSISNLLGDNVLFFYDIFHLMGYMYFIKVYYRKFVDYTENNGLGITIMLLFSIVLVSFLFTMVVEDVTPLDSIAMVSNAFTSNSFDAAGTTTLGKLDSIVLAWSGFILSGVGTATLAASMVRRYVNRQFDAMEELIKNKKKEK